MIQRDGYLNICEAAEYLDAPVRLLWSHYAARVDPLFYLGKTRAERDGGPWYQANDLDAYRPHLDAALRRYRKKPEV